MAARPLLLQLAAFSPELEAGLARDFEVHRLDLAADHERLLADHGERVRAIATPGNVGLPNDLVERLPNLGIIAVHGVGFDRIDLDLARSRGIRVTTTPDVLTDDVADLAVALTLALFRRIPAADAHVRAGDWPRGAFPLSRRLSGSRFGIVGLGRIGSAIATRLAPFGPVLYTGPRAKSVEWPFVADIHALAAQVDVLILAAPANASTDRIVDASVLEALGKNGFLVNIARGALVDEAALVAALVDQRIAGAALDVFTEEPAVPEALLSLLNVVLTPHVGSATVEGRREMAALVLANLRAFLAGEPLASPLI